MTPSDLTRMAKAWLVRSVLELEMAIVFVPSDNLKFLRLTVPDVPFQSSTNWPSVWPRTQEESGRISFIISVWPTGVPVGVGVGVSVTVTGIVGVGLGIPTVKMLEYEVSRSMK